MRSSNGTSKLPTAAVGRLVIVIHSYKDGAIAINRQWKQVVQKEDTADGSLLTSRAVDSLVNIALHRADIHPLSDLRHTLLALHIVIRRLRLPSLHTHPHAVIPRVSLSISVLQHDRQGSRSIEMLWRHMTNPFHP